MILLNYTRQFGKIYNKGKGRQNGCKIPYIIAEDLESSVLDEIVKISKQRSFVSTAFWALKEKNDSQIQELKKRMFVTKAKIREVNLWTG